LELISSGIARLDTMLAGGFYRGSSILVSGTAGTGKTSICAYFANETCRRGERRLYFAYEESRKQIVRNMRSIGVDLAPWDEKGLLRFHNVRPNTYGLEMHLAMMHKLIGELKPSVVINDPVTQLVHAGTKAEARSVLTRLVDLMKTEQITSLATSLTSAGDPLEGTEIGVSSIMDTWIVLREMETDGEGNRGLYILKSRGADHSNQVREFVLGSDGIDLVDVYVGQAGVMTGAARAAQDARERAMALECKEEIERMERDLHRERGALDARIALLRSEFEAREEQLRTAISKARTREDVLAGERSAMARLRKADEEVSKG